MTAPGTTVDGMAPEMSCRVTSNFVLYFEVRHGRARLKSIIPKLGGGLTREYLVDPSNFVSFDVSQRFLNLLAEESGDPEFARSAGRFIATPEAMGFVYYMLKALGSPRLCYQKVFEIGPTLNRVGGFEVETLTDTHLRARYHSVLPEENRRACDVRMGQLSALPTIWGLSEARIVEHECQVRGAAGCLYDLHWEPMSRPGLYAFAGALGGVGLSFVAGELGPAAIDPSGVLLAALAVGGFSAGLALHFRRDARNHASYIGQQSAGLAGSLHDLHARFSEIQQLNATLEQKVADRTRDLEVTGAQLKAALDKQLELDRIKTQFFQNISHELRTPLTLILAPLDTLATESPLDPASRAHVEVVRRSALRLLGLINSLLDLSKLDAGKLRLALDDIDPAMIVRQLVETAQGLARQRGITLSYTGPERLPLLPIDTDKFEKAVLNLLSNALKFTGEVPGRAAEIEVSIGIEDERLLVTVRDTGIGIPESEISNIFGRFHQVDGSDQRRFGGTGIGLALVKDLIEFHCGTVTVESEPGVGSTFRLDLPTRRDAYPDERLDRRRGREEVLVDRRSESERQKLAQLIANPADLALADIQAGTGEPGEAAAPVAPVGSLTTVERPRLLVADDNRDMLAYLKTILSRDYEVFTAADGEEAFELALRHLPQVIVSDVMMPRKNGYTLVKDLKRHPQTRSIPVVLVTAKADVYQKVAGIDAGADDYLTKPFNFLELRARIKQLLRARSLERSLAEKNDYLAKLNFDLVLAKKEVFLQTIEAMAFALEAKDPYTHGHSRRVALLAEGVGREMKLTELEVERVRISAVLHDIGKLGIPESILRKEGRLDKVEEDIIRRHPEIGFRILESVRDLADVNRCILLHHERWDGQGYPSSRLAGDIPLESRIIAVADTYDAMTSDRPYRKGLGHARAMRELRECAGSQFDPDCVRAFIHLYDEKSPEFPVFPSVFGKATA